MPRLGLFLALASCAAPGPAPEVSAAPAGDGALRVRFRRLGGSDPDLPPELRAEGGRLEEVTYSPDLRAASALWREPKGALRCRFPYDGAAVFEAGGPVDREPARYVFLEAEGVLVTAELPRGCLLLPAVPLRIRLDGALLPARLLLPDGGAAPLGESAHAVVPLPRDGKGALRRGDFELRLETARGAFSFLIGIDGDGTPAAVSGYFPD